MLKVEILTRMSEVDEYETILVVNGEKYDDAQAWQFNDELSARIFGKDKFQLFYEQKVSSLKAIFSTISFYNGFEWCPEAKDWRGKHYIEQYFEFSRGGPHINYELNVDTESWANPWSVTDFVNKLEQTVEYLNVPGLTFYTDEEFAMNGFGVKCQIRDIEATAADEVLYWNPIVARILDDTLDALQADIHADKVVSLFQFPQPIATACEQYLLYFVQFLSDLGVEADAEIRHSAKSVLFSVTPKHGPDALERIRESLDIYLRIPGSPTFSVEAASINDIAVRQLEGNVYHFKSQLALASALIKAKDATIEMLELSNYQYRQLLVNSQSIEAAESKNPEENEIILNGAVSITPYEGPGFQLNLPHLLRKLKRRFKSND